MKLTKISLFLLTMQLIAQPTTTSIVGPIYNSTGGLYSGSFTVQAQAKTNTGWVIVGTSPPITVYVINGTIGGLNLVPNDTSVPNLSSYYIQYANGDKWFCIVPTSSTPVAFTAACSPNSTPPITSTPFSVSQIIPAQVNGYVLTTVAGISQWAASAGGSFCTGSAAIGNVATATSTGTSPTCTWQSSTVPTFQTNGVSLTTQTPVNFVNSAPINGQTFTFSNPSVGRVQLGVTGTLNNAGLTNSTFSTSIVSWLTASASTALGGTLAIAANTGQASHQVIGTCGTATAFSPCSLTAGDVPPLSDTVLDSNYATIALACSAAGSEGYVQLTTVHNATPTQTLNCNLWPLGGTIQPGSSQLITWNGTYFGPNTAQIWDVSAGGHIDVSQNTLLNEVTPKQYGAKGDGSTDDTAVFNEVSRSIELNQSAFPGVPRLGINITPGIYIVSNWNVTANSLPTNCQITGTSGCYSPLYITANRGSLGSYTTTLKAKAGSTGYVISVLDAVHFTMTGFSVDGAGVESCIQSDWVDAGPSLGNKYDGIFYQNCNGTRAFSAVNQNDSIFDHLVQAGTGGGNSSYALYLSATGGACAVREINAGLNKVLLDCQNISLGTGGGESYLRGGLEIGTAGLDHLVVTNTQIEQAPDTHIVVNCINGFTCSNMVFESSYLAPSGLSAGGFIFNGPFAQGVIFTGGLIHVGSGAMYGNITTPQNGYFPMFEFKQSTFDITPPIPSNPSGTTGLYVRYDRCEDPGGGTIYPYTDTSKLLSPMPILAGTNITFTTSNTGITINSSGGVVPPSTTNLLSGNGAGGFSDSGIVPSTVVRSLAQSVLSNSSATSTVTLSSSPVSGDYEIHFDLDLHTPCTTGTGTLYLVIGWTGNSSRILTTGNLQLTSTQGSSNYLSGIMPIHVGGGSITFTPTLGSACVTGTATWDGNVYLTRTN